MAAAINNMMLTGLAAATHDQGDTPRNPQSDHPTGLPDIDDAETEMTSVFSRQQSANSVSTVNTDQPQPPHLQPVQFNWFNRPTTRRERIYLIVAQSVVTLGALTSGVFLGVGTKYPSQRVFSILAKTFSYSSAVFMILFLIWYTWMRYTERSF